MGKQFIWDCFSSLHAGFQAWSCKMVPEAFLWLRSEVVLPFTSVCACWLNALAYNHLPRVHKILGPTSKPRGISRACLVRVRRLLQFYTPWQFCLLIPVAAGAELLCDKVCRTKKTCGTSMWGMFRAQVLNMWIVNCGRCSSAMALHNLACRAGSQPHKGLL